MTTETMYYQSFASVYRELRDAIATEAKSQGYDCWGCCPWAEQTQGGDPVWLVRFGWFENPEEGRAAMNEIEDAAMATWKPAQ